MDHPTRRVPALLATGALLLGGCATTTQQPAEMASPTDPVGTVPQVAQTMVGQNEWEGDLAVSDQSGDGTSVTIDLAAIQGGRGVETAQGWVVIHPTEDGAVLPQVALGKAPLNGPNRRQDLTVPLDQPIEQDAELVAMLHIDAAPQGEFQFPGSDVPLDQDGDPLKRSFQYTVES